MFVDEDNKKSVASTHTIPKSKKIKASFKGELNFVIGFFSETIYNTREFQTIADATFF